MKKNSINKASIVYKYGGSLYVNLTNRCASACVFCIKNKWKGQFRGNMLKLKKEPTAGEVIKAIKDPKMYDEIVFCGYGEPLIRLEALKKIAAWVKSKNGRVRINTSGLANLYHGRNIVPELKGIVDSISVSLNSTNPKTYMQLHKPVFGLSSYSGVKAFVRKSVKDLPDVTVTFIDFPGVSADKCLKIAKSLGAKCRMRPYLDEVENQ